MAWRRNPLRLLHIGTHSFEYFWFYFHDKMQDVQRNGSLVLGLAEAPSADEAKSGPSISPSVAHDRSLFFGRINLREWRRSTSFET